jgi:hypothetical protein
VAVDAEQVLFVTVPVAGPFAVDANFPVTEFVAMALAAQPVRLGKIDQFAGDQSEFVTVFKIVAVRAPALTFRMMKHNIGVVFGQDPAKGIWFHVAMALGAREDPFGKRWSRYRKNIFWRPVLYIIGSALFSCCFLNNDQFSRAVKLLYPFRLTRDDIHYLHQHKSYNNQ